MSQALSGSPWSDVDASQREALKGVGVDDLAGLARIDPVLLSETLGIDVDQAVDWVVAARKRQTLPQQEPAATIEAIDQPPGGFVRLPASARRARAAPVADRISAVRGGVRAARRRIRRAGAGRKSARRLKRASRRLGDLRSDLLKQGISRRGVDEIDASLERLEGALGRFMDGPASKRRAKKLRRSVRAALARIDGSVVG